MIPLFTKLHTDISKSNSAYLYLLSLYSCALLMDHGIHWLHLKSTIFLFLIVILQFINYRVWWAGMAAVIVSICATLPYFPQTANHTNIMFLGSIIIFFLMIKKIVRGDAPEPDNISLTFRWVVIGVYFWAGFHKLNSGFFSLQGSCSVHINHYLNQLLYGGNFQPSLFVTRISQIGTIIVEMIVPFGLLYTSTRKLAAIVLALFHFYLALCNFTNFSAFASFLIIGSLLDLDQPITTTAQYNLKIFQGTAIVTACTSILLKKFRIASDDFEFLMYTNVIFSIGFAVFFIRFFIKYESVRSVGKITFIQAVCLLLISLWAIQGYVGLSTSSTLTMFSNLITERSRNNHYLIDTNRTKIWDFEEDYVEVIKLKSSHNLGKRYNMTEYYIPLIEFKNSAHAWTKSRDEKVECILRYKGSIIMIEDIKTSAFINKEWWARFLTYRGIPKNQQNECLW